MVAPTEITARRGSMQSRNVPVVEVRLPWWPTFNRSACVELHVKFQVCEIGLKAEGIETSRLRADVPMKAGGIVSFLGDASGDGAILFI